jgi:hypothetical protein
VPPIYHITHVSNLPGIIAHGGLICDRTAQNLKLVNIAHNNIKERRLRKPVPVGPGGTVGDYVPFYFAPLSPMLYAIFKNQVAGYTAGQQPVIYLCSSTEAVHAANCRWVFTEGHAVMDFTDFFDDFRDLQRIDWPLMRSKYWFDRDTYPDRSRRRQAEFLVHDSFPWNLVTNIVVYDAAIARVVNGILAGQPPAVNIKRDWYYQ